MIVHFLWIVRTAKFFLNVSGAICRVEHLWTALSSRASLDRPQPKRRIRLRSSHAETSQRLTVNKAVRRFEESIAGRAYQIEVASVDPNRWRACIVKAPGVPTALMPFYGPTADEAAELAATVADSRACTSRAIGPGGVSPSTRRSARRLS